MSSRLISLSLHFFDFPRKDAKDAKILFHVSSRSFAGNAKEIDTQGAGTRSNCTTFAFALYRKRSSTQVLAMLQYNRIGRTSLYVPPPKRARTSKVKPAMRPTILARIFTAALLICVTVLAISLLGFGAMVTANIAPWFSYQIDIDGAADLEIHNGSACPRELPFTVCQWSGLANRHEFRIVYHEHGLRHPLLLVGLPDR